MCIFPHMNIYAVWAVTLSQTPTKKYPFLPVFGTCETPCAEIRKFVIGLRMRTLIHVLLFKNGQNWCRISGQKSVLYCWRKTKHILASLGATPGAISPVNLLCECTPWLLTYIPDTVKPLMFACPLFRVFRVPNKTAKVKGTNINCRPKK